MIHMLPSAIDEFHVHNGIFFSRDLRAFDFRAERVLQVLACILHFGLGLPASGGRSS